MFRGYAVCWHVLLDRRLHNVIIMSCRILVYDNIIIIIWNDEYIYLSTYITKHDFTVLQSRKTVSAYL